MRFTFVSVGLKMTQQARLKILEEAAWLSRQSFGVLSIVLAIVLTIVNMYGESTVQNDAIILVRPFESANGEQVESADVAGRPKLTDAVYGEESNSNFSWFRLNTSDCPNFAPQFWALHKKFGTVADGNLENLQSAEFFPEDDREEDNKFQIECTDYDKEEDGDYCKDETGVWRMMNRTPMRWTTEGMRKCLANKHIMLIGDSRTRFQYISLASALIYGVFPQLKEGRTDPKAQVLPWLLKVAPRRWPAYYAETNSFLHTNISHELCYCYRPGSVSQARENRFLRVQSEFGDIQITYLQTFVDKVYLGPTFPPFLENGNMSCLINACDPDAIAEDTGKSELRFHVAQLLASGMLDQFCPKITHLFASTGWKDADIGCNLTKFSERTGARTWNIRPPFTTLEKWTLPINANQSCNASILDRTMFTLKAPPRLYLGDSIHVGSSLNEEFNHMMLDEICPDMD
jgi:hypothetical protein